MQIGMPMKGLRRKDDAMKAYSWYSKQLTQTASKINFFSTAAAMLLYLLATQHAGQLLFHQHL